MDGYTQEEEIIEEAPLTAEELFELHKEEINAAFEEKSFFKRFSEMCSGLSKPKASPEYKLAKVELQRLSAPILAIILPVIAVVSLIVITQVTSTGKETVEVEIATIQEDEAPPEEDPEEPEPIEPDPIDEVVDIQIDTPVVGPPSEMVSPTPTPTSEPLSVKPAQQESVALIKSPITFNKMQGSRNPGTIGAMTSGGNSLGDAATEAAVMKFLRWLKWKQQPNGAFGPIAHTSLGILAFLAHGETPSSKEFGETVQNAIQFLINQQVTGKNGPTFKGTDGHEYATLIAAYALAEAYGMTRNPNVKEAATRILRRIIDNQSPTGGWDYCMKKESTRDDLSYEGWAIQALKAGKLAGLELEGMDECIKKAIRCLKTRNFRNGGFNYTAGGAPNGLTATGCLAMQLLGYGEEPEVKSALDYMREWLPVFKSKVGARAGGPLPGSNPQYYAYYAAQCKYQAGMCEGATPKNLKSWQDWNVAMKQLYTSSIKTIDQTIEGVDGKPKAMGYWEGGYNGTVMGSCLCALQLMVYYRYLPTSKIDKKAAKDSDAGRSKREAEKKKDTVDIEVDI